MTTCIASVTAHLCYHLTHLHTWKTVARALYSIHTFSSFLKCHTSIDPACIISVNTPSIALRRMLTLVCITAGS